MLSYQLIDDRKQEWVVFLHGIGGSRRTFKYQVEEFSRCYNLLLFDLHGHGDSMDERLAEKDNPSLEVVARDILAALDLLGIPKAHFVGMSSGTMVQTALANLAPERIHSLILSGAAIKFRLRAKVVFLLGNLFRILIPHMVLYRLFAWLMMPRKNHKYSRSIFVREAHKMPRQEFYIWFDLTQRFERDYPLEKHIATDVPKLYVLGDQDHMLAPLTARYARLDRNATIHVISQCGHLCNIDKSAEFNRVSLDFLARHAAGHVAKEMAGAPE
jgi:pimeloyl-ACP methyl ester carboxylesterase